MRHAPAATPGARALELACGMGENAIWLARRGYTVDAFDVRRVRTARGAAAHARS